MKEKSQDDLMSFYKRLFMTSDPVLLNSLYKESFIQNKEQVKELKHQGLTTI